MIRKLSITPVVACFILYLPPGPKIQIIESSSTCSSLAPRDATLYMQVVRLSGLVQAVNCCFNSHLNVNKNIKQCDYKYKKAVWNSNHFSSLSNLYFFLYHPVPLIVGCLSVILGLRNQKQWYAIKGCTQSEVTCLFACSRYLDKCKQ